MIFYKLSRQLGIFLFFLALIAPLSAQNGEDGSLFIPRNIRKAYEKGTRSHDGRPGPKYWQNRSEYRIDVSLDVKKRLVRGQASIQYFNNSPDTLKIVRLKLAHDLWRKGGQRNYDLTPSDITDEGMEVTALKVNGKSIADPNKLKGSTFLNAEVPGRLAPGGSANIEIDWQYTAPLGTDAPRECVCDAGSWFLAYWYPTVAVYDDLHGWADAPYNGTQEMYNDFSDYEVRMTVPGNTMVWATGELQNAAELFQPEVLARFEKARTGDELVKIFSPEDYAAKKPFFKKAKKHTYIYKASGVPDFSFAISDHFLWDGTSLVVDNETKRRTFVSAAYDPKSQDYYEVCKVARQAIHLMSNYQPGYPYPYPCMTVFNGNDGMEFPMMCNDASTFPNSPVGLTAHEISHTYFPFMMGINEQYYAWMDEGWASFFDVVLSDSIKGGNDGTLRNYFANAGTDNDMPPMVPARFLNSPAYRVAAYTRPQAAYFTMLDMLGYKKFRGCMTEYMNRWKGKHPMPFDYFNTWNSAAGQNMDWFWRPWFFEYGYPDLAVTEVQQAGNQTILRIENKGTLPVAIHAEVEFADGSKETAHLTALSWKDGRKIVTLPLKATGKKVKKVTLGHRFVADVNMEDNVWTER